MYVREKVVRRGEKEYRYHQLVEGRREGGRVRQRGVRHLGKLPSRDHADMLARQLGLLCSVLECGREGAEERRQGDLRVRLCADHTADSEGGENLLVYPLF